MGASGDTEDGRGWWIFFGIVSLIGGIVIAAIPFKSVTVLAVLAGIWFIVQGLFEILDGFLLRHMIKKSQITIVNRPGPVTGWQRCELPLAGQGPAARLAREGPPEAMSLTEYIVLFVLVATMGAGLPGPGDASLIAAGTLAGEGKLNVGMCWPRPWSPGCSGRSSGSGSASVAAAGCSTIRDGWRKAAGSCWPRAIAPSAVIPSSRP